LDAVGLAGEQQQRCSLRLPADTGDAAVARAGARGRPAIRASADAERGALGRGRRPLLDDVLIGNRLDEAGAEQRRGNPEDDVTAGEMSREIRLREPTAGRI